ncbi:DUF6879 family protein [Amycolatopsis sp. NPDC059021]|uniref:DUF6879 family protein n=1 Tax=Amycolatopsis sp. NPDC059021 TaxID=3346704 RepID=UPI003671C1FE
MLEFERSCYRYQALQTYGIPREQPSFREFLERGTYTIAEDDPGLVQTASRMSGGRILERVQLVRAPLSDYLRYVFPFFQRCAALGEDLRILEESWVATGDLPDFDFVLLDDTTVIKLHYSPDDGSVVGRELLSDASLDDFRAYRALALERSIPFLEYQRQLSG